MFGPQGFYSYKPGGTRVMCCPGMEEYATKHISHVHVNRAGLLDLQEPITWSKPSVRTMFDD